MGCSLSYDTNFETSRQRTQTSQNGFHEIDSELGHRKGRQRITTQNHYYYDELHLCHAVLE